MSHIETGNTKLSLSVMADLAAALEVRVDDLLSDQPAYTANDALAEIAVLLQECSGEEARVVADVVKATCHSLKTHLR